MATTILVTGAAGFAGSHLLDLLARDGADDVVHSTMLQQRVSGFYNAQCCGIAVEYQSYNFTGIAGVPIPADHRFFMSFTLAGLGNFSPFNGALGGVPR